MERFFQKQDSQTLYNLMEHLQPDIGDLLFLLHKSCDDYCQYCRQTIKEPHLEALVDYLTNHLKERLNHYTVMLYEQLRRKNYNAGLHFLHQQQRDFLKKKLVMEQQICQCNHRKEITGGCPLEIPLMASIKSYEDIQKETLEEWEKIERIKRQPIINQIGPSLSYYSLEEWEKRVSREAPMKNPKGYYRQMLLALKEFQKGYFNLSHSHEVPVFRYFPKEQTDTNKLNEVYLSLRFLLSKLYQNEIPQEGPFYYIFQNRHPHLLRRFFDQLVRHGYLQKKCSFQDFGKFWKGEVPGKPMQWQGSLGELHFLLTYPVQTLKVVDRNGQYFWDFATRYFSLPKGRTIRKDQLRKSHDPTNPEKLKAICQELVPEKVW